METVAAIVKEINSFITTVQLNAMLSSKVVFTVHIGRVMAPIVPLANRYILRSDFPGTLILKKNIANGVKFYIYKRNARGLLSFLKT